MNGPEHYAEAARLLGLISDPSNARAVAEAGGHQAIAAIVASAQAHATLAQVALTANVSALPEFPLVDHPRWSAEAPNLTWADVL